MQASTTSSAQKKSPAVKPASPQEPKYFELDVDMGLPTAPRVLWANEKQMRVGFPASSQLPFGGLDVSAAPQIAFDRSKRRGKLRDVYHGLLGMWFMSDRLKQMLEQIDPQAFVFVRATVDYSNFEDPGPAYWLCDLVRKLDCIDDEKSKFTLYDEVDFKAYKAFIDIKMRADVVGDAHAFRLVHKHGAQIVDDSIVRALNAAKIRGFRFTPIQQN